MKQLTLVILFISTCLFQPAMAQEDSGGGEMVFTLDPVLVSRFQSTENLEPQAERIRSILHAGIEQQFLAIPLADVPPFENYDAVVYLKSCPVSELVGCAYVIGSRASVEWVVTGTVSRALDDGEITLDGEDSVDNAALRVGIQIIDIVDSRVALSFDARVTPETESLFTQTVVEVLDKLVEGEGRLKDLRGKVEDPVLEQQREQLEKSILASTLADLERELGGMVRNSKEGQLSAPKLTQQDLDALEQRDDTPPWERLKMSRKEYRRFKNSGRDFFTWNTMKRGRQGQLLLTVSPAFGLGFYEQWFDGRWALDRQTLQVVEVDEWQAVKTGTSGGVDFGVGLGILPSLDFTIDVGMRGSGYHFLFHKEVEDEPLDADAPERLPMETFRFGALITFAPMPTWKIRPTISGGFSLWFGKPVDAMIDMNSVAAVEVLPAPRLAFLHVVPGGELRLNKNLVFFARMNVSFLVGGNRVERLHLLNEGKLQTTSEPVGGWTPGLEGVLGLQVRIGPLFGAQPKSRIMDDDFED